MTMPNDEAADEALLREIQACTYCDDLPLGPKPVLRFSSQAPVLVVGQAPGTHVHNTGIPWNDLSGQRLRKWLDVDSATFYDAKLFSIVPMGYCYPGKAPSGDLPPRRTCARLWLPRILRLLKARKLTLLVGNYAQRHYLGERAKQNLTENVRSWQEYLPEYFVLPHPSPLNNRWLKKHPWFEHEVVPALREKVAAILRE